MKKVANNEKFDIIECKQGKKDIVCITLVENATIRNKKTKEEYINGTFMKIIDRKCRTRILDLISGIDITNIKGLEIKYNDKTTEKTIFMGC